MSKLFGKVMASLLSGAMLFGCTSFADGGLSKLCLVEDEDMRDGENVKECAICSNSVECERDGETVKITKRVSTDYGEKIVKVTKQWWGVKKLIRLFKGKDEEVCNVKVGCCGNYFCRECILEWMNAGKGNSNRCPVCRRELDIDSAKSLLTSYERLQSKVGRVCNALVRRCKKRPFNAGCIGICLASLLCSPRNQKIPEIDCDVDCGDLSFDDDVDCEGCIAQ